MHRRKTALGPARSSVAISSTKRSTPQLSTSTSVWASTPEAPAFAFGLYRASRRGHGTPQGRFALEVQLDKIAEAIGLDPAELRLRQLVSPDSLTANYLRIGSTGLRQCLETVVERSGWRQKHGQLPFGRGVGLACSSYLSGAGVAIYWNRMPHSSVMLKLDRGGGGRRGSSPRSRSRPPRTRHNLTRISACRSPTWAGGTRRCARRNGPWRCCQSSETPSTVRATSTT